MIRTDISGRTPAIGDWVAYNPPYYKGLKIAIVIDFAKSGLPIIIDKDEVKDYENADAEDKSCYRYTPKTGFVVIK